MELEKLVSKYIKNTEQVFKEMRTCQDSMIIKVEKIEEVIETAKCYLEDAKYYQEKMKHETSLVSVAYSEGLLDSLRFLGAIEFSWQTKK